MMALSMRKLWSGLFTISKALLEGIHKPYRPFFRHFHPLPLWNILLIKKLCSDVKILRTSPVPLSCPHGLWMTPYLLKHDVRTRPDTPHKNVSISISSQVPVSSMTVLWYIEGRLLLKHTILWGRDS